MFVLALKSTIETNILLLTDHLYSFHLLFSHRYYVKNENKKTDIGAGNKLVLQ